MGNFDGIADAFMHHGTNEVEEFGGGYFSFAFRDEIALVFDSKARTGARNYYILNCSEELWDKVKEQLKKDSDIEVLKKFWLKQSKTYEISEWSSDFSDLEREGNND
jgi:hypothetical protein